MRCHLSPFIKHRRGSLGFLAALTGLCASGSVKNVRSWMVTTTGTPGRSGIE